MMTKHIIIMINNRCVCTEDTSQLGCGSCKDLLIVLFHLDVSLLSLGHYKLLIRSLLVNL